jgi:hypothetical protein
MDLLHFPFFVVFAAVLLYLFLIPDTEKLVPCASHSSRATLHSGVDEVCPSTGSDLLSCIVIISCSAPNPEDPLDATVAEHWTVRLCLPCFHMLIAQFTGYIEKPTRGRTTRC